MRVAPPAFVAEMQRRFGAMWDVRFNEHLQRWVVVGPTADGRSVEQTWGWFQRFDGVTGQMVQVPCGADGLPPYRDFDADAQAEILANMEQSYTFNREDGDTSVKARMARILRENNARRALQRTARAAGYADLVLSFAGTRRSDHVRARGAVLVSSAVGTRRTALFEHHNGKPLSSLIPR